MRAGDIQKHKIGAGSHGWGLTYQTPYEIVADLRRLSPVLAQPRMKNRHEANENQRYRLSGQVA